MFTGIVTHNGEIRAVEPFSGGRRVRIAADMAAAGIALGASILHSGVCLTVTEIAPMPGGVHYVVEISPETLARTTLGAWRVGGRTNLERSLKAGDEFGGHFVTGHIYATGRVIARREEGEWTLLGFAAPGSLARFIAEKGSIAVDGVSLTVNSVEDVAPSAEDGCTFSVTVIPHTAMNTTLGALQMGDRVNLEIDLIARYVARAAGFS